MKTVPVTATPFRIIKLRSRVVYPSYSTRTKYDITIINSWVVVSTQKLATQNHILCNDQVVMGPTTFKRSLSEYQHTSMLTLDMQLLLLDLSESSESHQTIEPCQCLFIDKEKYLYYICLYIIYGNCQLRTILSHQYRNQSYQKST